MATERVLFSLQSGAELTVNAKEKAQGITNKYRISVDPEVLYLSASVGPARDAERYSRQQVNSEFLLFPNNSGFKFATVIKLQADRYGQYVEGVDTFSGLVNGDETTSFVFSIENSQLNGQVRLGEYLLKLAYDKLQESHVLTLIDIRLMPKDSKEAEIMRKIAAASKLASATPEGGSNQAMMSSSGQGNIRILFYYTQAVAARNNVSAMVANILSELNTSIDLSKINPEIDFTSAGQLQLADNMVGLCKVRFGLFGNPLDSVWLRMLNRNFPFANVDADILQTNADISLSILTAETGDDYNDCAYPRHRLGGVVTGVFQISEPHAMTADTYAIGLLTALHEVGHVIGGNHEIDDVDFLVGDGTPSFARGYASNGETWQTIMGGYAGGCPFVALPGQPACIRLNRWSNPAIYYQGEVTGVANESDMESALEINAPIASGWTAYPDPAPASAPSLTVSPGPCFGFNVLLCSGLLLIQPRITNYSNRLRQHFLVVASVSRYLLV